MLLYVSAGQILLPLISMYFSGKPYEKGRDNQVGHGCREISESSNVLHSTRHYGGNDRPNEKQSEKNLEI